VTENQKKPPPGGGGGGGEYFLGAPGASLLGGPPPPPGGGTSWKRRQTSLFTHTQLSLAIFKGEMWQPKGSYRGGREAKKGRTKDKEGYINFGKISNFGKV